MQQYLYNHTHMHASESSMFVPSFVLPQSFAFIYDADPPLVITGTLNQQNGDWEPMLDGSAKDVAATLKKRAAGRRARAALEW